MTEPIENEMALVRMGYPVGSSEYFLRGTLVAGVAALAAIGVTVAGISMFFVHSPVSAGERSGFLVMILTGIGLVAAIGYGYHRSIWRDLRATRRFSDFSLEVQDTEVAPGKTLSVTAGMEPTTPVEVASAAVRLESYNLHRPNDNARNMREIHYRDRRNVMESSGKNGSLSTSEGLEREFAFEAPTDRGDFVTMDGTALEWAVILECELADGGTVIEFEKLESHL